MAEALFTYSDKEVERYTKLDEILKRATSVLILSHGSPDADALGSCLAMEVLLQKFYPNIKATTIQNFGPFRSREENLKLPGYDRIESIHQVDDTNYDLVLALDVADTQRIMRNLTMKSFTCPVVNIDHHQLNPDEHFALRVNFHRCSTTFEIFHIFNYLFGEEFIDSIDADLSYLLQIGAIFDQNNFLYETTSVSSYKVMSILTEKFRVNKMAVMKELNVITPKGLDIYKMYLENTLIKDGFVYSYLSDELFEEGEYTDEDVKTANYNFNELFMRNIQGVDWGFVVKRRRSTPGIYNASFKAIEGTIPVVEIAKMLGGGGHKYGCGASFEADSVFNAIEKILEATDRFMSGYIPEE